MTTTIYDIIRELDRRMRELIAVYLSGGWSLEEQLKMQRKIHALENARDTLAREFGEEDSDE